MKAWLASFDWVRIGRTFVQVFGGTLTTLAVAFLIDYGADGVVNLYAYVYGQSGLIVLCTTAWAAWMNRPLPTTLKVVKPFD